MIRHLQKADKYPSKSVAAQPRFAVTQQARRTCGTNAALITARPRLWQSQATSPGGVVRLESVGGNFWIGVVNALLIELAVVLAWWVL